MSGSFLGVVAGYMQVVLHLPAASVGLLLVIYGAFRDSAEPVELRLIHQVVVRDPRGGGEEDSCEYVAV